MGASTFKVSRKIALVLEYDGTAYAGMQFQKNAPTVQAVVEEAVLALTGAAVRVKAAGRTDAGVHAKGQVTVFETTSELPDERFHSGLNHYLPNDVAVKAAYSVGKDFDPRRDATARVYRYTLLNRKGRSPLRRAFAYHVPLPLDIAAMHQALASVEGERDFACFSGYVEASKSTVRRLMRTEVWREGDEVHLELEGNSFLPQQVRRMAAAVLEVGLGKMTIAGFQVMTESSIRGIAALVLPAHGLCLREVHYKEFPVGNHEGQSNHQTQITGEVEPTLAGR